ncbi:MAG: hypothetical protein KGJ13_02300 [Patescibacteria group bacterium]|nr:hypothetical protein [Patescibacteria group bacterium]
MPKRLIFTILALVALTCAHVRANPLQFAPVPQTYEAVASFTPPGNGANAVGFVNGSSSFDVRVLQVSVSVSSANASGGLMAFDVFTSTTISVGGTAQTATIPLRAPFFANPDSNISVSTGPLNVANEASYPVFRPLLVNDGNSATSNFFDSVGPTAPANGGELKLPAGANRGLLIEQEPAIGTTSYTAGTLWVRILYTVTAGANGSPN